LIIRKNKKGSGTMKYFINTNPYKDCRGIVEEVDRIMLENGCKREYSGEDVNLGISIGGDGTFLDTAKICKKAEILGINLGTLGYLAEVEPQNVTQALNSYLNNKYYIQERMRLTAVICKGISEGPDMHALNDIVITKDKSSVIDVEISVDGINTARYYADGVIVSTPTGSTGYAFSCGAPIIDPSSNMIIITPVAPHTIMNRSMIVSPSSEVSIRLMGARADNSAKVSVDGTQYSMDVRSIVKIKKSSDTTKVVKFNPSSFFNRIVEKMK